LDKPLLIHERSAQTEVLEIIKKCGNSFMFCFFEEILLFSFFFTSYTSLPPIIIRGFMGSTEEALKYLELGYYLGLTGYLCKVGLYNFDRSTFTTNR
jgi:TatD DNase family protein